MVGRKKRMRSRRALFALVLLLLLPALATLVAAQGPPAALDLRGGRDPASAGARGSGTATDPWVWEGGRYESRDGYAIFLQNLTGHLALRNLTVSGRAVLYAANVTNLTIEGVRAEGSNDGMIFESVDNLWINKTSVATVFQGIRVTAGNVSMENVEIRARDALILKGAKASLLHMDLRGTRTGLWAVGTTGVYEGIETGVASDAGVRIVGGAAEILRSFVRGLDTSLHAQGVRRLVSADVTYALGPLGIEMVKELRSSGDRVQNIRGNAAEVVLSDDVVFEKTAGSTIGGFVAQASNLTLRDVQVFDFVGDRHVRAASSRVALEGTRFIGFGGAGGIVADASAVYFNGSRSEFDTDHVGLEANFSVLGGTAIASFRTPPGREGNAGVVLRRSTHDASLGESWKGFAVQGFETGLLVDKGTDVAIETAELRSVGVGASIAGWSRVAFVGTNWAASTGAFSGLRTGFEVNEHSVLEMRGVRWGTSGNRTLLYANDSLVRLQGASLEFFAGAQKGVVMRLNRSALEIEGTSIDTIVTVARVEGLVAPFLGPLPNASRIHATTLTALGSDLPAFVFEDTAVEVSASSIHSRFGLVAIGTHLVVRDDTRMTNPVEMLDREAASIAVHRGREGIPKTTLTEGIEPFFRPARASLIEKSRVADLLLEEVAWEAGLALEHNEIDRAVVNSSAAVFYRGSIGDLRVLRSGTPLTPVYLDEVKLTDALFEEVDAHVTIARADIHGRMTIGNTTSVGPRVQESTFWGLPSARVVPPSLLLYNADARIEHSTFEGGAGAWVEKSELPAFVQNVFATNRTSLTVRESGAWIHGNTFHRNGTGLSLNVSGTSFHDVEAADNWFYKPISWSKDGRIVHNYVYTALVVPKGDEVPTITHNRIDELDLRDRFSAYELPQQAALDNRTPVIAFNRIGRVLAPHGEYHANEHMPNGAIGPPIRQHDDPRGPRLYGNAFDQTPVHCHAYYDGRPDVDGSGSPIVTYDRLRYEPEPFGDCPRNGLYVPSHFFERTAAQADVGFRGTQYPLDAIVAPARAVGAPIEVKDAAAAPCRGLVLRNLHVTVEPTSAETARITGKVETTREGPAGGDECDAPAAIRLGFSVDGKGIKGGAGDAPISADVSPGSITSVLFVAALDSKAFGPQQLAAEIRLRELGAVTETYSLSDARSAAGKDEAVVATPGGGILAVSAVGAAVSVGVLVGSGTGSGVFDRSGGPGGPGGPGGLGGPGGPSGPTPEQLRASFQHYRASLPNQVTLADGTIVSGDSIAAGKVARDLMIARLREGSEQVDRLRHESADARRARLEGIMDRIREIQDGKVDDINTAWGKLAEDEPFLRTRMSGSDATLLDILSEMGGDPSDLVRELEQYEKHIEHADRMHEREISRLKDMTDPNELVKLGGDRWSEVLDEKTSTTVLGRDLETLRQDAEAANAQAEYSDQKRNVALAGVGGAMAVTGTAATAAAALGFIGTGPVGWVAGAVALGGYALTGYSAADHVSRIVGANYGSQAAGGVAMSLGERQAEVAHQQYFHAVQSAKTELAIEVLSFGTVHLAGKLGDVAQTLRPGAIDIDAPSAPRVARADFEIGAPRPRERVDVRPPDDRGAITGRTAPEDAIGPARGRDLDVRPMRPDPEHAAKLDDAIAREAAIARHEREAREALRAAEAPTPRAQPPAERLAAIEPGGMVPEHVDLYQRVAKKHDDVIMMQATSKGGVDHIRQADSQPKPMDWKPKSADEGPLAGLMPADQSQGKAGKPSEAVLKEYGGGSDLPLDVQKRNVIETFQHKVDDKVAAGWQDVDLKVPVKDPATGQVSLVEVGGQHRYLKEPFVAPDGKTYVAVAREVEFVHPQTGETVVKKGFVVPDYDQMAVATKTPQATRLSDPNVGDLSAHEAKLIDDMQAASERVTPLTGHGPAARVVGFDPGINYPVTAIEPDAVRSIPQGPVVKDIDSPLRHDLRHHDPDRHLKAYYNELEARGYQLEVNEKWLYDPVSNPTGWRRDENYRWMVGGELPAGPRSDPDASASASRASVDAGEGGSGMKISDRAYEYWGNVEKTNFETAANAMRDTPLRDAVDALPNKFDPQESAAIARAMRSAREAGVPDAEILRILEQGPPVKGDGSMADRIYTSGKKVELPGDQVRWDPLDPAPARTYALEEARLNALGGATRPSAETLAQNRELVEQFLKARSGALAPAERASILQSLERDPELVHKLTRVHQLERDGWHPLWTKAEAESFVDWVRNGPPQLPASDARPVSPPPKRSDGA